MDQTARAIVNLAKCFEGPRLPRDVVIQSLESLIRLALAEHIAGPVLATHADMARVNEIIAESKKAS